MKNQDKIAVVLFNLGGPDKLESVKPFLFNLFNDKAIIPLPQPFRWMIAKLISGLRSDKSRKIYEKLGGKSPLLDYTQAQAQALEKSLSDQTDAAVKVFIAMRYWHPLTQDTFKQVLSYNPDRVILLPLYPQFSTTTTASSDLEWKNIAKNHNFNVPTQTICCYFMEDNFIKAHAQLIDTYLIEAKPFGPPRILFSAHGIPQKCVDKGDPYEWQIQQSVTAIVNELEKQEKQAIDYKVCYQSKVGPAKWLEPTLDHEIEAAATEQKSIIVVPISFVSEHSETLVELDMDYQQKAQDLKISYYGRVPTLNNHPLYIQSLTQEVLKSINNQWSCPGCLKQFTKCPNA